MILVMIRYIFNFFCLILLALDTSAQSVVPDLTLSLEITHADHQKYRTLAFEVPNGIERLSVETNFSQKEQKTVIDLGLLDSSGKIVGWSGGNKDRFTVSAIDATPSFSPHIINSGRWQLLLGIPNIREGVTSTFQAKIYFSSSVNSPSSPQWVSPVLNSNPGWYRGDLHLHSGHSDGSCKNSSASQEIPCPVFLIAQKANELKLDFISLSDHNTVSQANSIRELQPYYDHLLMIPSRELTSFFGHANLIGNLDSFDFMANDSINGWINPLREIQNKPFPAFVSINHPNFPNGEICMGCGWTFDPKVLEQDLIQGVEVANGDDVGTVFSGLPFWLHLLEEGRRLTAVAGSDNHHVDQSEKNRGFLARPTNVVFAHELSTQAITSALTHGHSYIDFARQNAPEPKRIVDFNAQMGSQNFLMGDLIKLDNASSEIAIHIKLQNAQGSIARIHISPNLSIPTELGKISSQTYENNFKINPPLGRSWIFLELYDDSNKLSLMTNAIYFDMN